MSQCRTLGTSDAVNRMHDPIGTNGVIQSRMSNPAAIAIVEFIKPPCMGGTGASGCPDIEGGSLEHTPSWKARQPSILDYFLLAVPFISMSNAKSLAALRPINSMKLSAALLPGADVDPIWIWGTMLPLKF